MKTAEKVISNPLIVQLKFIKYRCPSCRDTDYRCLFYRGVPLIDMSIKRESTVIVYAAMEGGGGGTTICGLYRYVLLKGTVFEQFTVG